MRFQLLAQEPADVYHLAVRFHPCSLRFLTQRVSALIIGLIFLAVVGAYLLHSSVRSTISREAKHLEATSRVQVENVPIQPLDLAGATYVGYLRDVRALARFAGGLYAATSAGLVNIDDAFRQ